MQSTWLEARLKSGPLRLGQVSIESDLLRHWDDREIPPERLALLPDLAALRELLKTDASGGFRPVRGAPTLRRGWRTPSLPPPARVEWLNVIYPTAIAFAAEQEKKTLRVTPFAETVQRQTGMYRLTQLATPDQVARTIENVCVPGCLRQRLWSGEEKTGATNELPLLCPEACNYFVSKCRETMVADRKRAEV